MAEGDKSPDDYRRALDEYREVGANFRYYGDLRFKQLTLYGAITAALVGAYTTGDEDLFRPLASWMGLIATVGFFALEYRATAHRKRYVLLGRELEKALGFRMFTYTRLGWDWSTSLVYTALFLPLAFFWGSRIFLQYVLK